MAPKQTRLSRLVGLVGALLACTAAVVFALSSVTAASEHADATQPPDEAGSGASAARSAVRPKPNGDAPGDTRAGAPAQATVTPGHIVVRGTIYYTDRLGDRNHPAAGVRVEIWDRDQQFPATGDKLAETVTDADGRFVSREITNVDPDGPTRATEGTQDLFLKLVTDNGTIRLLQSGTNQPYDWTSYEINERNGQMRNVPDGVVGFPTQYIVEHTPHVEALWTYVNMAEAWHFVGDETGQDPGTLLGYWSRGSQDGPRYDPQSRELHFRDENAGFSDTVMQYTAYALLHNIYVDLPTPWQTCLDAVPWDPRLATSPACALFHGLAVFLPLGAHGDPGYETADLRPIDMDAAASGSAGWEDGDAVPGRVAGALWDLHEGDATEDGFDAFNATFAEVWDVFAQRNPTTMREWWDGWLDLGYDGCGAVGSLFQNTIDYNTAPVVQAIPDVVIDEDDSAIVDLKNYVDDPECDDETIAIEMVDAGAPEAGVTLLPTNVISITPQADWFGRTVVSLRVSDGLVATDISFNVIVVPKNDCPIIDPRVPDPPPARYADPITLDLERHGQDTEDASADLAWDVEIDERHRADLTVLGRGTTSLTFLLEPMVRGSYSVIVTLVVRDADGCEARQAVALYWTSEGNDPPLIRTDRFTQSYRAPMNTTIRVDLTGVADDPEDGTVPLEWFVLNGEELDAQVHKVDRQVIDFEPRVGFVGANVAQLEVQDTGAARTTAAITLTWTSRAAVGNQPPRILRHRLLGRTVGAGSAACYDLTDKAVDPDHNQLSLRWYAEPEDDRDLFVGAQGTRRLCLTARPGYEGCLWARFTVRDPRDASDDHDVRTCWRTMDLLLPIVTR